MTNTNLSVLDRIDINLYKYMYTASIAKEAVESGQSNSGGILIIGMVIVIVGIIGFILTSNKK